MQHRRLTHNYETLPTNSASMITVALIDNFASMITVALIDNFARRLTAETTPTWRDPQLTKDHKDLRP